jgi:protein MpaA
VGRRSRIAVVAGLVAAVCASGVATPGSPAAAASCTITHALRWGARDPDVRCVEQTLVAAGYALTGPDDFYGLSTSLAVRAYQAAHALAVDGVVGAQTATALGVWAGPAGDVPLGRRSDTSIVQEVRIGTSVQGRPLVAIQRGTPGGKPVMIVGVIHGDEDEGIRVVDKLRSLPVPPGVDLWLVPTINPDGTALGIRHNARRVDLNRNFPRGWAPLGSPGYWQYAGASAASEPETQAMVALLQQVKPVITIWYHQDLDQVDPGGHDREVVDTYARIVSQRVEDVVGGTYTGTATQFNNSLRPDSTAFVVELPPRVPGTMVLRHATAALAVAAL